MLWRFFPFSVPWNSVNSWAQLGSEAVDPCRPAPDTSSGQLPPAPVSEVCLQLLSMTPRRKLSMLDSMGEILIDLCRASFDFYLLNWCETLLNSGMLTHSRTTLLGSETSTDINSTFAYGVMKLNLSSPKWLI